jgi:hypothetical protein
VALVPSGLLKAAAVSGVGGTSFVEGAWLSCVLLAITVRGARQRLIGRGVSCIGHAVGDCLLDVRELIADAG